MKSGLIVERLALGTAALLCPQLFISRAARSDEAKIYIRAFGIRHLLLGLVFWRGQLNRKQLANFALANAAVELTDGAILVRGFRSSRLKWLALGSLVGACGCLAIGATARQAAR